MIPASGTTLLISYVSSIPKWLKCLKSFHGTIKYGKWLTSSYEKSINPWDISNRYLSLLIRFSLFSVYSLEICDYHDLRPRNNGSSTQRVVWNGSWWYFPLYLLAVLCPYQNQIYTHTKESRYINQSKEHWQRKWQKRFTKTIHVDCKNVIVLENR